MQPGSRDAAGTSSTSLISFRLEEISKNLTTGRGKSFWYMLEPLLVSKSVFDALTPDQQKVMAEVGEAMQAFGLAAAKADDEQIAAIYTKPGVKVHDMNDTTIEPCPKIPQPPACKHF